MVSRYIRKPRKYHWEAIKWILRYLKRSSTIRIVFEAQTYALIVVGYVDSNYDGDLEKRRCLTRYLFVFGTGLVSWKTNFQKVMTLSLIEAEYIAIIESMKKIPWLKGIMSKLGYKHDTIVIHYDNHSALHLSKKPQYHEKNIY